MYWYRLGPWLDRRMSCLAIGLSLCLVLLGGESICRGTGTQEGTPQDSRLQEAAGAGLSDELRNQREQEIRAYLDELREAFAAEDQEAIRERLSIDAMIESVRARGVADFDEIGQQEAFKEGFSEGIGQAIAGWSRMMGWDQHDIRKIEWESPTRAIVSVRNWHDQLEVHTKMRWWLVRSSEEGRWQFYDFEDLDQGLRVSSVMGSTLTGILSQAPWVQPFLRIARTMQTAEDELQLIEGIQSDVKQLLEYSLPEDLRVFTVVMRSTALINLEEDPESALALMDELKNLKASYPMLDYLRGTAHQAASRWEEAIKWFEQYADTMGWDADVCESVADCYWDLGEIAKANEMARKGLDDQPTSWGCLATFAISLPEDRSSELFERMDKIDNPEGAFETVIDWALTNEKEDIARKVYLRLEVKHPNSELLEYYREFFLQ